MATFAGAARLIAAVAAVSAGGTFAASTQPRATTTMSVASPSLTRPEFTRPAGIPGSARASEKYLLSPAQPTDPAAPKKRNKP